MEQKKIKKSVRKVKVYPKYVSRPNGTVVIAELRLSGAWLSSIGFETGKYVEVSCEQNRIVLTVCSELPNEGTMR